MLIPEPRNSVESSGTLRAAPPSADHPYRTDRPVQIRESAYRCCCRWYRPESCSG
ncbi:hypothetical protein ACFFX0_23360 [Citricoccus parietis]|uniref:Uncharacterized protein n=1 Tax=Citricoccus parietis TaxID=592307 RepID=A0ABV5G4V5_9MICC